MRFSRFLPVLLCSTVLAGCGGSNLLDGSSAEDLQSSIARVEQAVDDGRCEEAMTAATEGLSRVEDLPSSVDDQLVSRLRQGFEELEQRIPSDCTPREATTTEPPPTTTTEPPPTTTTEPPATTTEPEPEPEPTTTTTTPTEPPGTTTDEVPLGEDDSGGTPPAEPEGGAEADPATPRGLRELRQNMRELRESGREARERLEDSVRNATDRFRGDR